MVFVWNFQLGLFEKRLRKYPNSHWNSHKTNGFGATKHPAAIHQLSTSCWPCGSFLGAFVVGRGITSRKTHQNIVVPYYFDTDLLLFSTPFFRLVVSNIFNINFRYGMSSFPLTNLYFSRWLLHRQPGMISEFIDYIPAYNYYQNRDDVLYQNYQNMFLCPMYKHSAFLGVVLLLTIINHIVSIY